jgi:hypothetical protein
MKNDPPMWGQYVKVKKTGRIVENRGYNPTTGIITIKSDDGLESDVAWTEVERITGNEEADYLVSRNKKSN